MPARTTDQRDRNSDEGRDRSHRIGAMMPGIGPERGAFRPLAESINQSEKKLLHDDHQQQHDQGEGRRRVMRFENRLDTLHRDHERGCEHA